MMVPTLELARGNMQPISIIYNFTPEIYNSRMLGTNHPEQNLQTNLIKTSSIRSDIGLSLIFEKQLEADTLKL